jgi:transglutaminase-like putative cysteine protease
MTATDSLGELIATLGSVDNDEIDWPSVRHATVLIHQTFRYEYPEPITSLRQRLMVVPPDYHGEQRLVTHKLRVSGSNLDSERSYDSFGNVVLDLTLEEVDSAVEFATWAVIERDVPVNGGNNPDDVGFDKRLAHPSRLTEPDGLLRAVADEARSSGARGLELADLIGRLVHDHFSYELDASTIDTTAAQAWAGGVGVCQDYAHCMLALCRLCDLPARYVSGHLLGEGGTHAWVEVLLPDSEGIVRVVPFDPTHDRRAGPQYVTVAVGRDYRDVAPVSGTFVGPRPGVLFTHKRAAVTRVEYVQPARRHRIGRGADGPKLDLA